MEKTKPFMSLKDIARCAMFTALTAVLAQLSIPASWGVPWTLQTLAVSLAGIALGAKRGFFAILAYVLLGLIGVPVFAGFSGGIGVVFGKTGGFIISFPVMAAIIGAVCERTSNKYIVFLSMLAGAAVNYLFGMLFFRLIVPGSTLYQAFTLCVLPYIPTGLLKSLAAVWLGTAIKQIKAVNLSG